MLKLNRRRFTLACAAGVPMLATVARAASDKSPKRLGIGSASYGFRSGWSRRQQEQPGFNDPLTYLDFCHVRGAGGIQIGLGNHDNDYAARLRDQAAAHGMFVEGSIRLPKDAAEVERFAAEAKFARQCGARVLRTVMLNGRRYETFDSAESFAKFADGAWKSLTLAAPVITRQKLQLAVENHKDWRAEQLVAMLTRLGNENVGACVDFGNNVALLEDPLTTARTLAPHAYSCHVKDMGVQEYADGFLLSEVPLGEGFLDLQAIVKLLRAANPQINFSLEMITRDPLKVPVLTDKYWATFADLPARHLAETLAMVRRNASQKPLPKVAGLNDEQRLAYEDENVRKSLAYAREQLGL